MIKTAGIHVSGSNASRSAFVVLSGNPLVEPLTVEKVYDRIGSSQGLFSDERIVSIVQHESPFASLFLDCPLSVPPCVSCQRTQCPGVIACEDVSVAYMLSMSSTIRRSGARKKRPINPQSQRLWDVVHHAKSELGFEPSYSSNLAPLVVRAQTLRRRLRAFDSNLEINETAVPQALKVICEMVGIDANLRFTYRSFDNGVRVRRQILDALAGNRWLAGSASPSLDFKKIEVSVDVFHAFVAAFTASLYKQDLVANRSPDFPIGDGWVYLPKFSSELRV